MKLLLLTFTPPMVLTNLALTYMSNCAGLALQAGQEAVLPRHLAALQDGLGAPQDSGWLSAPGPLDGGERRWMLWADLRAASPANVQLQAMSR